MYRVMVQSILYVCSPQVVVVVYLLLLLFVPCSCVDADRVEVVRVAARNVQRLAGRLVEVAQTIAREGGVEEGGGVQQTTQEEAELLKREWASQVSGGGV